MYSRLEYDLETDEIDYADQGISRLVAAGRMTGLEALLANLTIETARREVEGKRLNAVRQATDTKMKGRKPAGKCLHPNAHAPGCMCKRLQKYLDNLEENQNVQP